MLNKFVVFERVMGPPGQQRLKVVLRENAGGSWERAITTFEVADMPDLCQAINTYMLGKGA